MPACREEPGEIDRPQTHTRTEKRERQREKERREREGERELVEARDGRPLGVVHRFKSSGLSIDSKP